MGKTLTPKEIVEKKRWTNFSRLIEKAVVNSGILKNAFKISKNSYDEQLLICARSLIYIAELLEGNARRPHKKREPSEWAKFAGEQLRAGKTIKEAAELWKIKKAEK